MSIEWLDHPQEQDYPNAASYLTDENTDIPVQLTGSLA